MPKAKTIYTGADVDAFIQAFANTEQRIKDSFELKELMQNLTGEPARMWGPTIISFGNYHYKYASGHEGDAPLLAFSPRKTALTLYVYSDTVKSNKLIEQLGKFKKSKACIYVNKLADINKEILKELCIESIKYLSENYEYSCRKN